MLSRFTMLFASLMIILAVYLLVGQEPAALSAQNPPTGAQETRLHNAQIATIEFGGTLGSVYSPNNVRISPGDSVEWLGDFAMHPLVSDDGLWQVVGTGTDFSYTFDQTGTYDYHCQVHSALGMRGTVTVGYFGFLPLVTR
jgi:plastocyanin